MGVGERGDERGVGGGVGTVYPLQGGWWSYLLSWTSLHFGRDWTLFIPVTTNASALNTNASQLELEAVLYRRTSGFLQLLLHILQSCPEFDLLE